MAKETNPTPVTNASSPKIRKRPPLFREPNAKGDVIYADEVAGLNVYFQNHPDANNRNGRVKVPNDYLLVKKSIDDPAPTKEWEYDPHKTGEREFEQQFGAGEYYIEPYSLEGGFMSGRNLNLIGPKRYQGQLGAPPEEETEEEETEEGEEEETEEGEEEEVDPKMQAMFDKVTQMAAQNASLVEQIAQMRMHPPTPPAPAGPSREEYWQSEISKLRTEYTADTMRAHTKHIEEIARVRQEASQEANQQRVLNDQTVANLRSAFQSEMNGLKDGHRNDFENMRKDLREQVTSLRNEADSLRKEHRTELDGIRKSHDEDMKAERQRLGNELAAKTDETKESRSELRQQLKDVESDFRLFRGTAESNLSAVRTAHETFVMGASTETARLNNELMRAEMKIKDAERRAAELQKELDKKSTEADRIRQDAEKARERAEKETEEAEKALADEYRRAAEREIPIQQQQPSGPQQNTDDEPPVPEWMLKYGPGLWEQGKKLVDDNREQAKIAQAAAAAAQQAAAQLAATQEQLQNFMREQAQQQAQREWEARQPQQPPQGQYWAPPVQPPQPVVQQPPPPENHPPAPEAVQNGAGDPVDEDSQVISE